MTDRCDICGVDIKQNRNFMRIEQYRNDQKENDFVVGIYCKKCIRRIYMTFMATATVLKESENG